jgi:glycosyltransferase involved in cell wall biosynthesis
VDEIVDLEPSLHVLFVAPASDVLHQLRNRRVPTVTRSRLERVHPRIHVLRPRKWLPRLVGPYADRSLDRQVLDAVGELGLHRPLLWINDASYASLAVQTGWPSLYDITDDWLLFPLTARERKRLEADERILIERSQEVVVCSPELARSRGSTRAVELIPNGVDVELFRSERPRPTDLPSAPVAVYVGSLHTERIDVPLVLDLSRALPGVAVVLVGPSSLPPTVEAELVAAPNVHLLGSRPYDQVPSYLQHADVVVVPHRVNPFTESLDPIKAYECLAAGRPTVATPVAGFRELGPPVVIADRSRFVAATERALESAPPAGLPVEFDETPVPSWQQRAQAMLTVMARARRQGAVR